MANVKLSVGGSPVVNYQQCNGTPQFMGAPYGQKALMPDGPHFNAHIDAVMKPIVSYPLRPAHIEVQRNNIRAAKPQVGDGFFLVYVPVNHWVKALRLDVSRDDPIMAGASVELAGWVEEWDPATEAFVVRNSTDISDACTAQSIGDIRVDVPSSTMLWLTKEVNGYSVPLYMKPLLRQYTDAQGATIYEWHESGAYHLGFKVKTQPSDTSVTWDQMRGAIHLVAYVEGLDCMSTI